MIKERGNKYLRWADRYLGIVLIALLRPFIFKREFPQTLHSIALFKAAGIGDTVILSGIIQDLKKNLPQVELTLFTGSSNFEMAKMIPGIKVIKLPMVNPWECARIIRQHSFDLWIDFDPWPRINALLSFIAKARFKRGYKTPNQYRHYLYDSSIEHLKTCHEIDNYRNLIRDFCPSVDELPFIPLQVESRSDSKDIVLHLHPGGSRAALKMWPEDKWLSLVQYLHAKGYQMYFTGGKSESAEIDAFIKKSGLSSLSNVAGKMTLSQTAALLKNSFAVISVDTGIMHLAGALGSHVICLHGPTSPKRWGALGPKVRAITPNIDYKPCINLGFENTCKTNRCMQALQLNQVIQTIENLEKDIHPIL